MKTATITIRMPPKLKSGLEARARAQHRSLSAQVVAELESANRAASDPPQSEGRFLGRFEGTKLPSDAEIEEVRSLLWGALIEPMNSPENDA